MITTDDGFLGGRITLRQPAKGYRAGVDPVLLVAACPAKPGDKVLDLGCGVGTAALCLAARVPGVHLSGVEVLDEYANLAQYNAQACGVQMSIQVADATARPTPFSDQSFDHIITNPPYFPNQDHFAAKDAGRAKGRGGAIDLDAWIETAAKRLAPKGQLTLIQRMDRLPEVLAALTPRLGSIIARPLAATSDAQPHLVIVHAKKSGRAKFMMHQAVPLHAGPADGNGRKQYTDQIENILRNGAAFTI